MKSIDVSDRNYGRLLGYAVSFEDDPDAVIGRLLDWIEHLASKGDALKLSVDTFTRAKSGDLLPEGEYWRPILEILVEHGGEAKGSQVIAELEGRLAHRFTKHDKDTLEMGEVRWKNRARFARLRMKEQGLVSDQSPRGIWAITPLGHRFLDGSDQGS